MPVPGTSGGVSSTSSSRQQITNQHSVPPPPVYNSSLTSATNVRQQSPTVSESFSQSQLHQSLSASGAQCSPSSGEHHHVMRVGHESESSISARRDDSGLGSNSGNGESMEVSSSSFSHHHPVPHNASASTGSRVLTSMNQVVTTAPRGMSAEPALTSMLTESGRIPSRRSPDGPRVQAVSPFGVKENLIPSDCQVVKQLYREVTSAHYSGSPVPNPPAYPGALGSQQPQASEPRSSSQQQDPMLQNMLQQYQALVMQQKPKQTSEKISTSQTELNSVSLPAFGITTTNDAELAARTNLYNAMAAQVAASGGERGNPPQAREQRTQEGYGAQPNVVPSFGARDAGGSGSRDSPQDVGAHVSTRMLGVLSEDNKKLRQELEGYIKKTAKLQQLELHYQKVQREYEDLVRRQEKREQLELQMRKKLEIETRRIMEENRILHDQIEQLTFQMHQYHIEEQDDVRQEVAKLNMIIAQLMPQNKELMACKERQDIELHAQRDTLEEQRNHIQILDKALAHTQEKALKLEEECRQKAMCAQRVEELQAKLHKMHDEMMKREEGHKKARAQLEAEVAQLQIQKAKDSPSLAVKKSGGGLRNGMDFEESVGKVKRELEEKDEELLEMKRKVMQWEKKYYEDVERKRSAREIEEDTKNQRIRQLEECSDKAERMAEESRSENEKCREVLIEQKNKISGLEQKIQHLETTVAERDSMIKALRKTIKLGDGSDEPMEERGTYFYPSPGDYSSIDVTRSRLDAVRKRLLQSPSQSRYSRIYHPKFPGSLDTTFCLEDIKGSKSADYSSLDRPGRHYTERDSDSPRARNGRMLHHRTESEGGGFYAPAMGTGAFAKKREIFTLPDMRRAARTKTPMLSQTGKGARPRSADEHILAQKSYEECIEEAGERSGDVSFREGTPTQEEREKSFPSFSQKSNEHLFHV